MGTTPPITPQGPATPPVGSTPQATPAGTIPLPTPRTSLPFGDDSADLDPPPAPPFMTPTQQARKQPLAGGQSLAARPGRPVAAAAGKPAAAVADASSVGDLAGDPPPSLVLPF
jgi:hypothetical protein